MHQPDTAPRRSIYFDYKVYPFVRPPELGGSAVGHAVAVVGAGPIGLALALELARHGVRCVLLEAEQQVSEGSRALAFTRRSLEILQQIGVGERIAATGLPWRYGNSFYRGRRVYRLDVPHDEDDRFSPLINLQQPFIEQYLVEAVQRQPLIDLRWGQKVTALEQSEDGVTATVDSPEGQYCLRADWLVACDGARSALRSLLGLRMEGASYEGRFVIADIRVELGLPTERLAFFDPEWNPGNTMLMHREPHGLWRVDYQLPAGESPEEALRPESLKARIDAQLAMIGHAGAHWEMDWCSVYSARAMTLPDYRAGRVLLCGDAAHLLPIFGVRGANTGWQDSQNLAWKLAYTVRGLAGPALLATYSQERVQAAREIIDEASKSTRFMTPPTRGFRLMRDAVLSLALTQEFPRPLLNWRTSRPHEYHDSPLNCADDDNALFAHGPNQGAPVRNVQLAPGDFLLDRYGAGFHLFLACADNRVPADVREAANDLRAAGTPLTLVLLRSGSAGADGHRDDSGRGRDSGGDSGNDSVSAAADAGADLALDDTQGRIRSRLGLTRGAGAVLARPDQHVCARWLTLDARRLKRAVRRALGH